MSSLSVHERIKLEKLFKMENGYVLDYSDSSFATAIAESMGINANDDKYKTYGTSKAKRLRAIWDIEPDNLIASQICLFLKSIKARRESAYWSVDEDESILISEVELIEKRLQGISPEKMLAEVFAENTDESIETLISSIQREINASKPQGALDRVHTLFVKYLRIKLKSANVETDRMIPLHGIYGIYVKKLREQALIETEMSEKILRSLSPVLEKYSDIRNNRSLAHDNDLVSNSEAQFIINCIANAMSFIESINPG